MKRLLLGFSVPAFWVLFVATPGCGGDTGNVGNIAGGAPATSMNEAGNGSTSGGMGGTSNVSASAGQGNVGQGGAGTTSGGTVHAGHFWLLSLYDDSTGSFGQVSAAFYTTTSPPCSSQTLGNCVLSTTCSHVVDDVSAGTLTVTSPATATLPAKDVTMVPNGDNTYTTGALGGAFSGGETAHIAASGGTVPAFSADLPVPLALLIQSPVPDATGVMLASASSDLVIQFSRGTTGVELYAQNDDGTLSCHSTLGASSLTIPKAALAASGGQLVLYTWATKEIVAGDFTITSGVVMNAFTTNKLHPVTIQLN